MTALVRLATRPVPAAVATSVASLVLLGFWVEASPGTDLGWLSWNLFLAWIPVGLAWAILAGVRRSAPSLVLAPLAVTWLLFLPNAPYMVTDLIHLRDDEAGPPALALAMLGAFALTGLVLFVVSVTAAQEAARRRLGPRAARLLVPACIWLSAVGIYLGRVLRWNSWDVIGDPAGSVADLLRHLDDPRTLAVAVILTGVMGAGLHIAVATASRVPARGPRA